MIKYEDNVSEAWSKYRELRNSQIVFRDTQDFKKSASRLSQNQIKSEFSQSQVFSEVNSIRELNLTSPKCIKSF